MTLLSQEIEMEQMSTTRFYFGAAFVLDIHRQHFPNPYINQQQACAVC